MVGCRCSSVPGSWLRVPERSMALDELYVGLTRLDSSGAGLDCLDLYAVEKALVNILSRRGPHAKCEYKSAAIEMWHV